MEDLKSRKRVGESKGRESEEDRRERDIWRRRARERERERERERDADCFKSAVSQALRFMSIGGFLGGLGGAMLLQQRGEQLQTAQPD